MTPKFAHGGIGDLLQALESAIAEKSIAVYSHFENAPDLFTPFGVEVVRFDHYKSLEELNSVFISGHPLPRKFYPQFPLLEPPVEQPKKRVIGIHVEGSALSNNFWRNRGMPTKNMSDEFMISLVKQIEEVMPDVFFYIFCSPSRSREIGKLMAGAIKGEFYMITFPKIWDSLSCVQHCHTVIGMDSCIKSMSAILSIPTITLVGNYQDAFRDANFLKPYVDDGIMQVVPFADIDRVPAVEVVKLMEL